MKTWQTWGAMHWKSEKKMTKNTFRIKSEASKCKQNNMYYVPKWYQNWQIVLISLEFSYLFIKDIEVTS